MLIPPHNELLPPQLPRPDKSLRQSASGSASTLSANLMPTERQTTIGVFNPSAVSKANLDMQRYDTKRLYSPNNAPSTITSETFLMAKSLSSPMYTHNAAQTKYFNISNSAIEEPRFTKKVSVLA